MRQESFFQNSERPNIGYSVEEVESIMDRAGDLLLLGRAVSYLRELTQPHPELGREGPVCPYLSLAISKGLVRLRTFDGEDLKGMVESLADQIELIEVEKDSDRILRNITVVLPGRSLGEIEVVQRSLKLEFVSRGLMLGEFHPICGVPGLHNPEFRPLRSPDPMLSVRQMVPSDIAFLKDHPVYFKAYLENFCDSLLSERQQELADKASRRFGFYGVLPSVIISELLSAGVFYEVVEHNAINPQEFADRFKVPLDQITKTIAVEIGGEHFVCVLPVNKKINLENIGASLIPAKEVESTYGEPIGGLSPIGKENVLLDASLFEHRVVFIGSGKVGQDISISFPNLLNVTKGKIQEISL